jgi:beta-xylosidase
MMITKLWILAALIVLLPSCVGGQTLDSELKQQGLSGNPVFEGWYADPEAISFGEEYWIYPTFSDYYGEQVNGRGVRQLTERQKRAINPQYLKQTFFDAFSSKDLVHWTKHPRVLDVEDISWAEYALWATSIIENDGKYYLFFSANDIQSDSETGGIGVAVSVSPAGPFYDALGKPLRNGSKITW